MRFIYLFSRRFAPVWIYWNFMFCLCIDRGRIPFLRFADSFDPGRKEAKHLCLLRWLCLSVRQETAPKVLSWQGRAIRAQSTSEDRAKVTAEVGTQGHPCKCQDLCGPAQKPTVSTDSASSPHTELNHPDKVCVASTRVLRAAHQEQRGCQHPAFNLLLTDSLLKWIIYYQDGKLSSDRKNLLNYDFLFLSASPCQ